jgi:hypothetical protein
MSKMTSRLATLRPAVARAMVALGLAAAIGGASAARADEVWRTYEWRSGRQVLVERHYQTTPPAVVYERPPAVIYEPAPPPRVIYEAPAAPPPVTYVQPPVTYVTPPPPPVTYVPPPPVTVFTR